MRKALSILFPLLLCLLSAFACAESAKPEAFTCGDYEYSLREDGTAEITDYNGQASELTIPDTVDDVKVTGIGDWAFAGFFSLTSVTIPESVTSIGDQAFYDCSSLTSVTIPESVTSIGDLAFASCTSLTGVTIPESVTYVGTNPFCHCEKLATIIVSPDHPVLAMIDRVLFSKPDKRLVWYPMSRKDRAYTIPPGIMNIGNYAFSGCTSLAGVTIPESVTSIGESAFCDCDSLMSVTIPESVTIIGDYAFCFCDSLTSMTIPESVTSIGNWAFSGCGSLTLTVPRDSYAAEYCKANGLNYTYPDSLEGLNN